MILSPNMSLPISTIGVDSGLQWEQNLNSSLTLLDQHDHSPGKGVPINSSSISISTDLPLNGNNLTLVRSIRFQPQLVALSGPADLGCLYEAGVDLWYNDANGNQVQITSGGTVNATSSGISSPPASAAFVSSVLVVNAAANTPANIRVASILLGNNTAGSNFLTLSPPSAMPSNYGLVLPNIPSVQSIMSLDTSGNISASYTVDNSTIVIASNVIQVPTSGITDLQIAPATISVDKMVAMSPSSTAPLSGFMQTPSCGSFTVTNGGSSVVTNLSGTLVVSGNRPVQINLQSDGTGVDSYVLLGGAAATRQAELRVRIDGADVGPYLIQNAGGLPSYTYPSSMISFLATGLSAGSHTIEIFAVAGASSTLQVIFASLTAFEI